MRANIYSKLQVLCHAREFAFLVDAHPVMRSVMCSVSTISVSERRSMLPGDGMAG
jgi:hypothetical protein